MDERRHAALHKRLKAKGGDAAKVQLFTDLHASHRPLLLGMIEMPRSRSMYHSMSRWVKSHFSIIRS